MGSDQESGRLAGGSGWYEKEDSNARGVTPGSLGDNGINIKQYCLVRPVDMSVEE